MDIYVILISVFTLFISIENSVARQLNDYILHYEEIHYRKDLLHQNHERTKRSLGTQPVHLQFSAFNKNFNLVLYPDNKIFSPTHKLKFTSRRDEQVDTSFIYNGHESNSPGSKVHGSIISGIFRGEVTIPEDTTYHIDAADKYIHHTKNPSIIYREKDMHLDPYRTKREASKGTGGCGLDSAYKWMDRVSRSAVDYNEPSRETRSVDQEDFFSNKYSENANRPHLRRERAAGGITTLNPNTCFLYLQSDPLFYDYVMYNTPSGAAKPPQQTRDEILAFFASHVNAITQIYSNTKFVELSSQDSGYQGVNFQVQRTSIMTNDTENCGKATATEYCRNNIDVSNFLNLNSQTDHHDFCLAYIFTYRDFTQGTLGLAWVGSPSRAAGGICETFKAYNEGSQGKQVMKSLNTGIVTLVNFGKPVPAKVSQLTFAHEVGHNFGSPHDSGQLCAPYGTSQSGASLGNYIMFPSATNGDKTHNSEFSLCSKDNITRVIGTIIQGQFDKVNCFKDSGSAFCGNGIVESGEECDCGYASDCTKRQDKCCNPKGSTNECKLKAGRVCSPTAGPCCTQSCEYVTLGSDMECRSKEDCTAASSCDGSQAACPEPTKAPNNTLCSDNKLVCIDGQCRGSVCRKIGWEECFLTKTDNSGNSANTQSLCYVSCQEVNTTTCISSYEKAEVEKNSVFKNLLIEIHNTTKGVELPAGSPCDNYRGYCDVFHKCRSIDAEGPLTRLKNLIFSDATFQTVKEWIVDHWWAVLLMGLGLILFMGAFIKVCAVHTPTHNPNLKPARKVSIPHGQNRRRQPAQQQQQQQPQHELRGPPPPYSAGPSGAPPHGHGPRYNDESRGGGGGRGRDYMMKGV